jgi:SAM-dependent methyltransferase
MSETTHKRTVAVIETLVDQLYQNRFPNQISARRNAVWQILCRGWFDRYIPDHGRVLVIGAGYCEFINNIKAGERVAVDLNPDTKKHAAANVSVHQGNVESLSDLFPTSRFDVVFMSNFLEHCRSRDQMLAVLRGTADVLDSGGKLLILGPNFRACYRDYFDYFDHHLPLTDRSVEEAVQLAGLIPEVVMPRTLPFSFRSALPSWPWLVRLYLKLPWVWRFFGAQFFIVARKGRAAPAANPQPLGKGEQTHQRKAS